MNKRTIISILIFVVVIGWIGWSARPDSKSVEIASSAGGNLIVDGSASFDFGNISMYAGKVKHQFRLINGSSTASEISRIYTSCMCTSVILETSDGRFGPYGMLGHGYVPKVNKVVNQNEDAKIEVTFDPAAHGPAGVGRIERTVSVENNLGQTLELQISATVTP